MTWVWLNIDTFNWVVHHNVSESNVSHALMICAWSNRSDGHTNCESGMNVFSEDVFGTLGNCVALVTWFWNYSIIEVSDLQSSEGNVSSPSIDSIGVEWEDWGLNGEIWKTDISQFLK